MSQFIELAPRHSEGQQLTKHILRGVLSRISVSNSSSLITNSLHQNFFRRNVSLKVEQEELDACNIYGQSLL
jgi:hypothetical protein